MNIKQCSMKLYQSKIVKSKSFESCLAQSFFLRRHCRTSGLFREILRSYSLARRQNVQAGGFFVKRPQLVVLGLELPRGFQALLHAAWLSSTKSSCLQASIIETSQNDSSQRKSNVAELKVGLFICITQWDQFLSCKQQYFGAKVVWICREKFFFQLIVTWLFL